MTEDLRKHIAVNPDEWWIRCKKCGEVFTAGQMYKLYADKNKELPPDRYYTKCPGCKKEDVLTRPEVFMAKGSIHTKKGRKH